MNLVAQVSTVNSLIKFVSGEQMYVALTAIGDNHFRTAERVLRNLPNAHDQAALLRIGISHLEGAHTAYQKERYPLENRKDFQGAFTKRFRLFSCLVACKKDIYTCCLLAACYAYLKEEGLVHLAIEHAEAAQQAHDNAGAQGRVLWAIEDYLFGITDIPALSQLREVPEVPLPAYKNNLLRILPELCNR